MGYNYRMTDLQAAIGLVQLQLLNSFIARRRMDRRRGVVVEINAHWKPDDTTCR